jgi:hypothetical protein
MRFVVIRRFYDSRTENIIVVGSIRHADVNYNSRSNNEAYQNRNKVVRSHYILDIQFQCPIAILMFQVLDGVFQISLF